MGFQINGTTVLDSSGIQNNANSFRTLDGNSILGSGNITDSGPADALYYGKVGVYTWSNYIPPVTSGQAVSNVDTTATVAAGGTVPASHLGKGDQHLTFEYFVGVMEPSQTVGWYNTSSITGRPNAHASSLYTGYSGTYRNMLAPKKGRYASLWIRIS